MAVEPTTNELETQEAGEKPKRRRRRGGRSASRKTAKPRKLAEETAEVLPDGASLTEDVVAVETLEPPAHAVPEFLREISTADVRDEPDETAAPLPRIELYDGEAEGEPVADLAGPSQTAVAVAEAPVAPAEAPPSARKRGRRGGRRRRGKGKADADGSAAQTAPAARTAKPGPLEDLDTDAELIERGPTEADLAEETDADLEAGERPARHANRDMIINNADGDECRIAILQDGRLEELFIERHSAEQYVGNIYSGRVTNVEPSIQAVFVDFGQAKNGFLHISDVQPQYFPDHRGEAEEVGKKVPRRDRPPIQRCFRRGDHVIVQVTKEGIGTKGPTLSTYLSIPGRFLVMMPGMSHLGVSRKIEDDAERRKMRDILGQLSLPKGMGFILRTAGVDQTKRELQRDLHYLNRLWKTVVERIRSRKPPAELYQESDLIIRTIRDVFTNEFKRIVVDDEPTAQKVREFLHIAMPRMPDIVETYSGREPLFHKFKIDAEIERINSRRVPLQSGGSIVIDPTEALVAIDVNSGKFRALDDAEETAYKINLEAAEEIARQLRLRDLGGVIVCDFIDMRYDRHKRAVEKALRDALKKHKERARILRTSAFGLIEMTRQRQRRSITRALYMDCTHCKGSGLIKTAESMALDVMRVIQLTIDRKDVHKVTITVSPEVATLVQNRRRAVLHKLEIDTGKVVVIRGDAAYTPDQMLCECEDDLARPVPFQP